MKTIEQAYSDHKAMIKSFAVKYSKRYYLEFDELEAECNLAFCSAYLKFNPEHNTKFSTYLYCCLQNCMKNYCASEMKRYIQETPLDNLLYHDYAITSNNKTDIDISEEDQQAVLNIALDLAPQKKANKKRITEELKNKGWTRNQILTAFRSIELELRYA